MSLNTSGTVFQLNTDLSIYDNSISEFGPKIFVKDTGGNALDVYWPSGVVPIVTTTADKADIYSFKTFDGGGSLYGIVGGQNFS